MPDKFEVDEEAKAWAKRHKEYQKRGNSKTYQVQLEHRQKYVTLSREEWRMLQSFMARHSLAEIKIENTEHLTTKVKAVIFDWCRLVRKSE